MCEVWTTGYYQTTAAQGNKKTVWDGGLFVSNFGILSKGQFMVSEECSKTSRAFV